jgi:predicted HNH restriction endonuclease
LHHLTYERAYHAELPEDLMALCRECHAATHGMRA